ncbi:unnamed protein product, partial [Nesidiocoris tenuis]
MLKTCATFANFLHIADSWSCGMGVLSSGSQQTLDTTSVQTYDRCSCGPPAD